jgi:diacylglycerol kinase (ATP)
MGLLPSGTGNLLARNLGTPLGDVPTAVRTACEGADRAVDVGWLELDRDAVGEYTERYAFLVMGGAGFDAAIMAGADHAMKTRLGPWAYVLSALRVLRDRTTRGTLSFDGQDAVHADSRGLIVGNCGTLTMGLSLMPDADPSDGILDTVVLLPRTPLQWVRAAWSVLTGRGSDLLPRHRSRRVEYRSAEPQQIEVDGDVVGTARRVRARVQRSGVLIRCGAPLPV